MNILRIVQGNTEKPAIKLSIQGRRIAASDVKKVEFAIGSEDLIVTYPEDGVTYESEAFHVPLTQEDTLSLPKGKGEYKVRVYFNDGTVKSTPRLPMVVDASISKVVLK